MNDILVNKPYRHYKGKLYLPLTVGIIERTEISIEEGGKVVIWVCYDLLRGSRIVATEKRHYDSWPRGVTTLWTADYTGTPRAFNGGEKVVAYVGLYDNPHGNRVCVRPVEEWNEQVEWFAPRKLGPRYELLP